MELGFGSVIRGALPSSSNLMLAGNRCGVKRACTETGGTVMSPTSSLQT